MGMDEDVFNQVRTIVSTDASTDRLRNTSAWAALVRRPDGGTNLTEETRGTSNTSHMELLAIACAMEQVKGPLCIFTDFDAAYIHIPRLLRLKRDGRPLAVSDKLTNGDLWARIIACIDKAPLGNYSVFNVHNLERSEEEAQLWERAGSGKDHKDAHNAAKAAAQKGKEQGVGVGV